MEKDIIEKLLESLHRTNEELVDISEKTIFSGPEIENVRDSIKAFWPGEEEMINAFRHSFEALQLEIEQSKAVDVTQEYERARITVAVKLSQQKILIEEKIQDLLKQQVEVELAILNNLKSLKSITILENEDEEEPSVYC